MNQNNLSGFNNPLNEHDYFSTRDSESMSTNETSQQTEVMVDGLQVYMNKYIIPYYSFTHFVNLFIFFLG